jgi:hypothetical protein
MEIEQFTNNRRYKRTLTKEGGGWCGPNLWETNNYGKHMANNTIIILQQMVLRLKHVVWQLK